MEKGNKLMDTNENINRISDEDFAFLSNYEDAFRTATESNYIKQAIGTANALRMKNIYSKLVGFEYKATMSCGKCVLNLVKRLSKFYYEERQYREEKRSGKADGTESQQDGTGSPDEKEIHSEEVSEGPQPNQNRRGRPRKVGS